MEPATKNMVDMYATRTLVPYIAINPGVPTFLRDRLFTNVRRFDTKKLFIDIKRGGRDIPTYVKGTEKGNFVEHDGFDTFAYEAPYLHEYKLLKPEDLQFREPSGTEYNYAPPASQLTEKLNKDAHDLDTRFNRIEELQAVEVLSTGKLIPKDKQGNAFPEINFQMKDTHKPVLSKKWSDPNVKKNDILEQLEDWNTDLLVKDGGHSVGLVVMGRNAKKWFMRKMDPDNESAGLDSVRVARGEIMPQHLPNGVSYIGRFSEVGNAPMYCYAEWYRDPWTKETKPIFPENMVLMVGVGSRFDRNYGFIQNINALRGLERFPWIKIDPDGKGVETHLETSPLLTPYEIDAVVAATVC